MKCIISGSRANITYEDVVTAIGLSGWNRLITEVVQGECPGEASADMHAKEWARVHSRILTGFEYLRGLGKAGGPMRNEQMALYVKPDGHCIAVPYDLSTSKGTASMVRIARKHNLDLFVYEVKSGNYWWERNGVTYGVGEVSSSVR